MPTSLSRIRVRGFHIDAFGVVNHARYLEFLEEARWAYLDERPALAASLRKAGMGHSVVNLNLDYLRPARLGDELKIETGLRRTGERSITFLQKIRLEPTGEPIITAKIANVFFELKTQKAVTVDHPAFAEWEELKELMDSD